MYEELQGEIYLYNILRRLFLAEPSRELIVELQALPHQQGDDPAIHGLMLMVAAAKQNGSRLDVWLEELAVEFTRVFVGPLNPLAVPYASFYLSQSRQLMTDETIEVRKRYLDAGMAINELYSLPDDHVGIELEFLYYLASEAASQMQQGHQEEAAIFQTRKSDFITSHMSLWIPQFSKQLSDATHEDLYIGAALLLDASFQN